MIVTDAIDSGGDAFVPLKLFDSQEQGPLDGLPKWPISNGPVEVDQTDKSLVGNTREAIH
jgi:hypothetical protein